MNDEKIPLVQVIISFAFLPFLIGFCARYFYSDLVTQIDTFGFYEINSDFSDSNNRFCSIVQLGFWKRFILYFNHSFHLLRNGKA